MVELAAAPALRDHHLLPSVRAELLPARPAELLASRHGLDLVDLWSANR
ncbi:hypothetical protein [Micromonospora nigra]|nr:hypothetical protein [Micromonospora nigra]